MYPFVNKFLKCCLGLNFQLVCRQYWLIARPLAKEFYAIKQYMQLSVLPFVGLIVMHIYVGTSELHCMKCLCFLILTFCLLMLTTDHK